MYENDRENRNDYSEAGYNDRNDEHMEYRSEASRKEENQEVRSEQHLTQESSQSSSAWQSAPQENSQSSSAWQSAPQNSGRAAGENGAAAWNTQNSQTADKDRAASWNAQASAQDSSRQGDAQTQEQHHTTGGWAPRRPEFHHASHQRPEHIKRSGRSMAGKIAGVTAAAVLFGTVAGGTMFAVDTAGEYLKGQYTTIGQTETQAQVKVAQSDEEDSSTTAGAPVTSAIQTDVSSIVENAAADLVWTEPDRRGSEQRFRHHCRPERRRAFDCYQ